MSKPQQLTYDKATGRYEYSNRVSVEEIRTFTLPLWKWQITLEINLTEMRKFLTKK